MIRWWSNTFYIFVTLAVLLIGKSNCTAQTKESEKAIVFRSFAVVTAHPNASAIGKQILSKGGNAIDAAVAVHFALAVCYPNAGNIGGGGFLVWRNNQGKKKGEARTLDFREKAPYASSKTMYLDSTGTPIPNLSLAGTLSVGVPGSVAGMVEAHKKLGTKPWKILLQPAIDLARNGVRLTEKQANEFNQFRSEFAQWNTSSICPLLSQPIWQEGDTIRQNDLAQTLEAIRDFGNDGFYKGETARKVIATMQTPRHNIRGVITEQDLNDYRAVWRKPLIGNYGRYSVITMPPPSSGGIALLQLLQLWTICNSRSKQNVLSQPFHSADAIHRMVECERRVYADRSQWLGDPDFVNVPTAGLLSPKYLQERMATFRMDTVTPSSQITYGTPKQKESEQTTHYSIVDSHGNAVSVTTTLNAWYGSKVMVAGAGFFLNNEMDDFSLKPGVPNFYGLIGSSSNAIEPAKRMLSSMTPTILVKDAKADFIVGTPGGATIITSVFQTIVNVLDYKFSMQRAVNAPRFHHQWLPDVIFCEEEFPSEILIELKKKGHTFKLREPIGRVDAIKRTKNGWECGADPRGDDTADGE